MNRNNFRVFQSVWESQRIMNTKWIIQCDEMKVLIKLDKLSKNGSIFDKLD